MVPPRFRLVSVAPGIRRTAHAGRTPARVCHHSTVRPVPADPSARHRHGDGIRDEILHAAAGLFTENGFAATSTRAIAMAVGVKQASLYYHFPSKDQLLTELLCRTVEPSLALAAALDRTGADAPARLHALATFDVRLLCSGPWNLGALYLLPEVRGPRFATFWADRGLLRKAYTRTVLDGGRAGRFATAEPTTADLVFALVESVIATRSEGRHADLEGLRRSIPDACLRLLSVPPEEIERAGRTSGALLRDLDPSSQP